MEIERPRLQIATARLELRAQATNDPRSSAAAAIGRGLLGDLDGAIARLEEALAVAPAHAAWWSDLSALYIARAARNTNAFDLPLALESAGRANALDANLPEAWFNRALALTQLGLRTAGTEAWNRSQQLEPNSRWRAEAASRQRALVELPQHTDAQLLREQLYDSLLPNWAGLPLDKRRAAAPQAAAAIKQLAAARGDAAAISGAWRILEGASIHLLDASREYGRARRLYNAARYEEARAGFDATLRYLHEVSHPLRAWATLHIGIIEYLRNDFARAAATLRALSNSPAETAPALQGHINWMRGMLAILDGHHAEGLDLYESAVAAFVRAQEPANADFVRALIAEDYDWLGDAQRAWSVRLTALRGATRPGAFLSAATTARAHGWTQLAAALQLESAAIARTRGRTTDLVDALRDLALTTAAAGERGRALTLLREAETLLKADTEPARVRVRADLDLALSRCGCAPADERLAAANRAVAHFEGVKALRRVPEALLARASAYRIAGAVDEARADIERAMSQLEREAQLAPATPLRRMLGSELRKVADVSTALEYAADDPAAAIAAADRGRAGVIGTNAANALRAPDVRRFVERLPAQTAILFFHAGEDSLLVGHLTRASVRMSSVPITHEALTNRVRAFSRNPSNVPLGRQLRQALVPDDLKSHQLVVIPDGALHLLPFAALPGRDARFLIEEHAIAHAPSLRWLTQGLRHETAVATFTALANPAIDRSRHVALANLPGAEREAHEAGAHYASRQVISGREATGAALRHALQTNHVVHFAGHALLNETDPVQSELVVAATQEGPLTAARLARTPEVTARLVVLAACNAASGYLNRAEGPLGLARSLLAAGVAEVVASLSVVNDDAAAALFAEFHKHYAAVPDAPRALRLAQMKLLRSSGPWSDPVIWGGFHAISAWPVHAER